MSYLESIRFFEVTRELRECKSCGEQKRVDEFSQKHDTQICNKCKAERMKEYRSRYVAKKKNNIDWDKIAKYAR